jgi:chorismate mutase/prephenate dehydratase
MAEDIEKLRKEIDALNDELAVLVQRRAGLTQRIGALKGGAAAYRPEREAAILRRVAKTNSGPLGAEPCSPCSARSSRRVARSMR